MDAIEQLNELYAEHRPIPQQLVREAMASASLELQSLASDVLTMAYHFVVPPIGVLESGRYLLQFYLRRIAEGPVDSTEVYSPNEAAGELASLMRNAWRMQDTVPEILEEIVTQCTALFRKSDEQTRLCIETGFLERVLEFPELRPLFQFWSNEADLREAYAMSLVWGTEHERPIGQVSRR